MSSPEKVFEYFASVDIDNQVYMTYEDFLRAITPYDFRDDVEVGSPNSKYQWTARYNGASSVC